MEFHRGANQVYMKTLENVDVKTFHQLHGGYFADKNHVFYKARVLEGVYPQNFVYVGDGYAKGDSRVFYSGDVLSADVDTFAVMSGVDGVYAKDRHTVFHEAERCDVRDPATFTFLKNHYFADKYNVYYSDHNFRVLEGANPATFMIFGDTAYAKDDTMVFFSGERVRGADANTFVAVADFYGVDGLHMFYMANFLANIDVYHVEQVGLSYYVRDHDSLYYRDVEVENVDVQKFYLIGGTGGIRPAFSNCGTDGKVIICDGKHVSSDATADMSRMTHSINAFRMDIPDL